MKNEVKTERILLYICIIFLFIIATIIFITKHNSVDPESKLVKNAYAILGDNNLDLCKGLPFYQGEDITYAKLDEDTKLCLAYRMLANKDIQDEELNKTTKQDYCYIDLENDKGFRVDEENKICTVQTITKDVLNAKYKEIFGKNISKNIDFALSGSKACYYDEKKGSYTCGSIIKQTFEIGWSPTTYRVISKAKKRKNKLYIYDYYLMINTDICYKTNDGLIKNNECSDKYTEETKINTKFVTKYGVKYVHIFEKDKDGNYFWTTSKLK